jgi:hypothetical protein
VTTRHAPAERRREGFASSSSLSSAEIEAKQSQLEEDLRLFEKRAYKEDARGPRASRNLTADWSGSNGLAYRIDQYGTRAVISEMTPWGISAVGKGQVGRNVARFAYQAADGTTGEAQFHVVSKSILEGTFTNFSYGTTTPIRLTR